MQSQEWALFDCPTCTVLPRTSDFNQSRARLSAGSFSGSALARRPLFLFFCWSAGLASSASSCSCCFCISCFMSTSG